MSPLRISLLGAVDVSCGEQPAIKFDYAKVCALLAYLAVESDREHGRESLVGLLWPEYPERSARQNLSQALYNLRRAIGGHDADEAPTPPYLTIEAQTIQFNRASDFWLDSEAFTTLLEGCDRHSSPQPELCDGCRDSLHEALALYRGDFLEGFSIGDSPEFEEWALLQREQYRRLLVEALGKLCGSHERLGEFAETISLARRWLALEPWEEDAHRQLMRALALSGQRNQALVHYGTCRRLLQEELDVEPSVETTTLYEQIRDGVDLQVEPPVRLHNLPAPLDPLLRREGELAAIAERLQNPDCRLLTLVGPGGIGKTHLAQVAAAAQLGNFEHGVYFVRLAALPSVQAIVPAIAQALSFAFRVEEDPRQQLIDYLHRKEMLLVLDNFDHLLDGVHLVLDILRAASGVKVLVTSRAVLHAQTEHIVALEGLDYPPAQTAGEQSTTQKELDEYGAVELFLYGSRRLRREFAPSSSDLEHVATICRRVEGMPLAILLASAWLSVLTPEEIAAQLHPESTGNGAASIDFLESDWQDLPERQRSMRRVFDRSWKLLSASQQSPCAAFSVFRGGCTRQAAQEVIGSSLRQLKNLVDRSLLHYTPSGRYEMHPLVREYAAQQLGKTPAEATEAAQRHAAYYVASLAKRSEELHGARQQAALSAIEADLENGRAACLWAVSNDQLAHMDRVVDGLCGFFSWRGRFQEGKEFCHRASEVLGGKSAGHDVLPEQDRIFVRLLVWRAFFSRELGQAELARELLHRANSLLQRREMDQLDTHAEEAFLLYGMGMDRRDRDNAEAQRFWEHSLALYRVLNDRPGTALVLSSLGRNAISFGDYSKAQRLFEESLAIRRALGDHRGIAGTLRGLGDVLTIEGKLEEGERMVRESIDLCREAGDFPGALDGLLTVAAILLYQGAFGSARPLFEECVAISDEMGPLSRLADAEESLAWCLVNLGRYAEAQVHFESVWTISRELDRTTANCQLGLGELELIRGAYPESCARLAKCAALQREIGQVDDLSIALADLARATCAAGARREAEGYLLEALQIAADTRAFAPALFSVGAAAFLSVDAEQPARAVELYAVMAQHPYAGNSRWWQDTLGNRIAAAAVALSAEEMEAARASGAARDLHETVADLLAEMEGCSPSGAE